MKQKHDSQTAWRWRTWWPKSQRDTIWPCLLYVQYTDVDSFCFMEKQMFYLKKNYNLCQKPPQTTSTNHERKVMHDINKHTQRIQVLISVATQNSIIHIISAMFCNVMSLNQIYIEHKASVTAKQHTFSLCFLFSLLPSYPLSYPFLFLHVSHPVSFDMKRQSSSLATTCLIYFFDFWTALVVLHVSLSFHGFFVMRICVCAWLCACAWEGEKGRLESIALKGAKKKVCGFLYIDGTLKKKKCISNSNELKRTINHKQLSIKTQAEKYPTAYKNPNPFCIFWVKRQCIKDSTKSNTKQETLP